MTGELPHPIRTGETIAMTAIAESTRLRRLLIAPLAVAGLLAVSACGDDEADTDNGEDTDQTETDGGDEANGEEDAEGEALTMDEVSANDSAESCWAVIDDTVYDLTGWIEEHPGGEGAIEQLCGTDATEAFEGQHAGSEGPEQQLAEMELGDLEG